MTVEALADPEGPAPPAPPLTLLHEDAWLIAVDKPAGLLVHRTALDAHEDDDVVTRLRAQRGEAVSPVHRLDKGTSGVLLLARDADTARAMGAAFAGRAVHKRYLALVRGWPADTGQTDAPLARDPEQPSTGQVHLEACTHWRVLRRLEWPVATRAGFDTTRGALVEVQPLTGRRHQIRRHFKQLGHPLIGDATHGKGPLNRALAAVLGGQRLWLHAWQVAMVHPHTGAPLRVRSDPGPEWDCCLGVAERARLDAEN
ncbi:pseudouridine synthase [Ideonella sp. A 288]|uniref:pseudouridine synthase n=1 Tax=Ideonella sp. A 288 TaxID=1962181 RepID=UPI000B4AA0BF|nr:pseudouridine synthase [Ideonella sp. A 288]